MKIRIEFEFEVPNVEYTYDELEEWIRFELGDNGHMKIKNPLEPYTIEPIFGSLEWEEI